MSIAGPVHMAFAYGVHRCLGPHLAQRELLIGLRELLTRLPPFRRATEGLFPMYLRQVREIKSLPLTWPNMEPASVRVADAVSPGGLHRPASAWS